MSKCCSLSCTWYFLVCKWHVNKMKINNISLIPDQWSVYCLVDKCQTQLSLMWMPRTAREWNREDSFGIRASSSVYSCFLHSFKNSLPVSSTGQVAVCNFSFRVGFVIFGLSKNHNRLIYTLKCLFPSRNKLCRSAINVINTPYRTAILWWYLHNNRNLCVKDTSIDCRERVC